jgi:hypothetical protein
MKLYERLFRLGHASEREGGCILMAATEERNDHGSQVSFNSFKSVASGSRSPTKKKKPVRISDCSNAIGSDIDRLKF